MIDMVLDCGRRFLLMFIDQYFEKMINFLLLEIFVSILKVKKKNVGGVGMINKRNVLVFLIVRFNDLR